MAKSRSSPGWRGITAAIAASILPALLVTSVADTGRAQAAGAPSLRVTGTVHTHLAPAPTVQYSAVTFLNASQGWVAGSVGNEGVTWVTSDAGARWRRAAIGPVQPLALDFVSANDGFALGQPTGVHCPANGCPNVVLHTADGGRTWWDAFSGGAATRAPLFLTSVAFTSPATGYALGYQGRCRGGLTCNTAVYRTRDAGRSWQPLHLSDFVPTSVQFPSARDGYLGGFVCRKTGCRAVVLSTTDAGARWTTRDLPLPIYPSDSVATIDVDFADAAHGWVLATPPEGVSMGGGFGPLLRTGDGGRTWVQQHASFSWGKSDPSVWAGFPSDLHFVSPRVGWLAVDAGAGSGVGGVDLTTDGGRDWTRIGGRALWSIAQVAPAGPNQAWAVGGPKLGGPSFVVHLRSDGRAEQVLPALSPDTAVALVGPEETVGLGLPSAPGAVLVRQGAHAPWRQAARLTRTLLPQALSARVLPSGGLAAWVAAEVCGSTAWAIWQSSNGGSSWRELDVAHHAWMGIRFFNTRVGVGVESASFAGKDSATLASTLDGGRTWRRGPSVPVSSELMAASFASPTVGYVVTLEASPSFTVWRTTDGGRRWRALGTLPFGGGGPVLLDTTGAGTTWLLVNSDLYRSTDAGATWTRLPLGGTPVVAMSFLGPKRGMLVLAGGGLLETFDGGRVWSQEP